MNTVLNITFGVCMGAVIGRLFCHRNYIHVLFAVISFVIYEIRVWQVMR